VRRQSQLATLILVAAFSTDHAHSAEQLKPGLGSEIVSQTCIPCHSLKLVTQNRADREGWLSMIRWMQEKQGLWQLGENEEKILDYLSTYYGPTKSFRRAPLPAELMPPIDS